MAMPSTDASALPTTPRERRWSLAAAIASVTVFGLSVGQSGPLLPLLLEQRGTNVTLNGLNAGATFIGVIVGPLLAPRLVQRFGIRDFLLVCFCLDIALFLAMKVFDSFTAWFVLRAVLGVVGSSIFTAGEFWINQLAGDVGRGRIIGIYAAALSAGFGTGLDPVADRHRGLGAVPGQRRDLRAGDAAAVRHRQRLARLRPGARRRSAAHVRPRAGHPRSCRGVRSVTVGADVAAADLGVRSGPSERMAAGTLSAIYFGAIALQVLIGWLSDRIARLAVLRLCGAVGLVGAVALLSVPWASPLMLFGLLFAWRAASGIYPVALSMAGDPFRGGDLVSVNAAMIIAYGLGGLQARRWAGSQWISATRKGCCGCLSCCSQRC